MESSGSSSTGDYSDGVYDKVEGPSHYAATHKPLPKLKPPMLPTVMLACLILLFVSCFVGILVSGLHFAHRVTSGDCLGQSWVMFSAILGLLYITLHLQAARKSEPVHRKQPPSQNPLHSSVIVVARLDAIAWAVSLIVVAVAVSKDPSPVSCVDLAACTAVVPAITLILCITEKATRPFDIPYLTNPSSAASSTITCRVSDFMQAMPEVSVEDSISRRGSSSSNSSQHGRAPRPNSHTQHAAAIAAANVGQTAGLSGPRPPPASVKEARPWNFTSFDHRTKQELAASVTEATQTSEARHHVGGPRALALSEKAMQTGVLPPPVCLQPKVVPLPVREDNQENIHTAGSRAPSQVSSGTWRKDWSVLAAETGYQSATTTPASTPGIGSHTSVKAASRCLSPVVEESRRLSGAVQQASIPANPVYRPRQLAQNTFLPPTTASSRTRSLTTPRSTGSSSYTYNTGASSGHTYDSASTPRPPSLPAVTDVRSGSPARVSPARVRLTRAQEALKVKGGARDTVVMLKRPPRLTGDGRARELQRSVVSTPVRPEYLRMPGSFEDYY